MVLFAFYAIRKGERVISAEKKPTYLPAEIEPIFFASVDIVTASGDMVNDSPSPDDTGSWTSP